MEQTLNAMRAASQANASNRSSPRMGLVSAYDPSHYAVKVLIQPEGTETGWMPIGTAWMGNGWGIVCPPSIGDQVEIVPIEGQAEAWVMSQRFFSDAQRPPADNVPSGAFLLQHQSGSLIRFANDGSVQLVTAGDLSATVGGSALIASEGTMTITAPTLDIVANVNITGNVTDNGHDIGSTHRHTQVQSGSALSGIPS